MGKEFADQYSLLHFAVGIIAYFFGFTLTTFNIIHIAFELFENTTLGMRIINTNFKNIWPGGKPESDSLKNSFGDVMFGMLGWWLASVVDGYGKQYNWYGMK